MNQITTFEQSITKFNTLAFEAHEKLYGVTAKQRLWITWIEQFMSAYAKISDSSRFKKVFVNYFNEYKKDFTHLIFTEEENESGETITKVNDFWLKIPKSGTTDSDNWTISESLCKGKIIYIKKDVPKVSLPVSELYEVCIKLFKDAKKKDESTRSFPSKFLYIFYNMFYFSIPEEEDLREVIKTNIDMLYEYLTTITSSKTNETLMDSLGGGLSKFLCKILDNEALLPGVTADNLQEKFQKKAKEFLTDENTETIANTLSKTISTLTKPSETEKPEDGIFAKLSNRFQKVTDEPEITKTIEKATDLLGKVTNTSVEPSKTPSLSTIIEGEGAEGSGGTEVSTEEIDDEGEEIAEDDEIINPEDQE